MKLSLIAAIFLLSTSSASATEYAALMKAKKYADVERMAAARLAKDPANAEALAARSTALAAAGNQSFLGDAIKYAEQCVSSHPANAGCQLALGKALGWKAITGGMMSAIGYAGDIRSAFKKAVELDPRNLDARFSLLQFYMMAPAIAGGGSGKASDLVAKTAAVSPDAVKIMQAMLEANDGSLAKAEAMALAARPSADEHLVERHEGLLNNIAGRFMSDKKLVDAERVVQTSLRLYPDSDTAAFLQARLRQEQGRHRDALTGLEALLAKHSRSYLLYRIGQSHQALGDKARAVAAFEKALAASPALNDKQKADARTQLATLKG